MFCIPQSSSITGTLQSDCLVSYLGHLLVGGLTPLQKSSQCILQPQPTWQERKKEKKKLFLYEESFFISMLNSFLDPMNIYVIFSSSSSNCLFIYKGQTNSLFLIIWYGLVLWHINHCWLFSAKSCFYICTKYMICKYIL